MFSSFRSLSKTLSGSSRHVVGQHQDLLDLTVDRRVPVGSLGVALRPLGEAEEGLDRREDRRDQADGGHEDSKPDRDLRLLVRERREHAGPDDRREDDDRDPQQEVPSSEPCREDVMGMLSGARALAPAP